MLACLCCLAVGSIASFSTMYYMPHLVQMTTFDKTVFSTHSVQLLQTSPSETYQRNSSKSSLKGSESANATTYANNASAVHESGVAAGLGGEGSVVQGDMEANPNRYDRGVVMSLHNGIASMGASLIRELRCLGNDEVIQVYHCFPDELSAEAQALLIRNDANVEIIDVCTEILGRQRSRSTAGSDGDQEPAVDDVFFGDERLAQGFQSYWLKPLALFHTKIKEVILLDADAVLMRDPADLRTMSGYERTGTVFFYDRVYAMRRFFNAVTKNGMQMLQYIVHRFDYKQFGLQGPRPSQRLKNSFAYKEATAHEMDSSMVLIDKRRAGKAMAILKHLILKVRFEFKFSWGDKEAFWLAYELAQQEYFFSPYGLSLLDSVPNADMEAHPETMCGSMAHYVPTENSTDVPELLYVNGKALLEPFPLGVDKSIAAEKSRMFNINPTHVTPRYHRSDLFDPKKRTSFECMDNLGGAKLPHYFYERLLRRRTHFFAAETKFYEGLDSCRP